MKRKFIDYYMSIAEMTAKLSYATRLQVGAVMVRDHKILATGYNGTPTGWDNQCEEWLPEHIDIDSREITPKQLVTKSSVIHAESNCIMKVARSTESSENATLFCTHAPCVDCAKLIYQSGISEVWFKDYYRDERGVVFLRMGGIYVNHYDTAF